MQKSKILAFLLALVVSIVLWFYAVTVVNPDDTITISGISVQFEGTEALTSQGLMLTGGDSTKVSIKVSGRRSDLKELNNETVTAIADVTRIAASRRQLSAQLERRLAQHRGNGRYQRNEPRTVTHLRHGQRH